MPKLTLADLDRELRSKKLRPFYLIYGSENYLVSTGVNRIRSFVETLNGGKFQPDRFSAKESKTVDIVACAETMPMLTQFRLIIVSETEGLKDPEAFLKYLKRPSPSSTIIFTAEKADGRTKFVQTFSENGAVIECKPLYDNQISDWLRVESGNLGKSISLEAARFIKEVVGRNTGELAAALEKLALYVGKKPMIDLTDVEAVLTETGERTVFEFANAVGRRDYGEALHILKRLREFGENEVMVLNMLARHWRLLTKAKEAGDGAPLAQVLGVNPFFAKDYAEQTRLFTRKELNKGFEILYKTDKLLKSSRIPKWMLLEKSVKELLNR